MKKLLVLIFAIGVGSSGFAFDNGFVFGLQAHFLGSYTDPHISKKDLDYLGGNKMLGMLGYIMRGNLDLTYIFDSPTYFKYKDNSVFGGLGLNFSLGIGQGFSGQISGQFNESLKKDILVYARVFMVPVIDFGVGLKTYFIKNRLSLNFGLYGKLPLDPHPTYELYTNLTPEETEQLLKGGIDFRPETGTLVVPADMMSKINPIGFIFRSGIEYIQPILPTMEMVVGFNLAYSIYRPKYVTMPKKVETAAIAAGRLRNPPVEVNFKKDQIKSFYMNSVDFGVSLGLNFKV